jgi:acetyl esterase/lipase
MNKPNARFLLVVALAVATFCATAQEKAPQPLRAQPGQPGFRRALPAGVKVLRDVEYVPGGGKSRSLDLFLPESAKPLPVVVWIHGGAWRAGSKEFCPGIPLSGHGFAVVSLNYRLSDEAVFPAQLDDCRAALRFLRANAKKYNLDADHVGVWGGSAGGHLVALLGTTGGRTQSTDGLSDKVQCVVDWYGPTDLTPDGPGKGQNIAVITQLLGGPLQEKLELATQASPLKQVTKDAAPFLIVHGDADHTVNPEHSRLLLAALHKAGVEATLQILPGAGHSGPQFTSAENLKLIEDFFRKHLVSAK